MEEEGLAEEEEEEEEYMKPAPPVTRMFLGEYSVPMLPATHDTKDVWRWHLLLFPRCHVSSEKETAFPNRATAQHFSPKLEKQ
jgi:hypothetical protein